MKKVLFKTIFTETSEWEEIYLINNIATISQNLL